LEGNLSHAQHREVHGDLPHQKKESNKSNPDESKTLISPQKVKVVVPPLLVLSKQGEDRERRRRKITGGERNLNPKIWVLTCGAQKKVYGMTRERSNGRLVGRVGSKPTRDTAIRTVLGRREEKVH